MKKITIILLAIFATACAKDKSVDAYQRDKLQKNLALYQSVAGSYSGIVTSQQNPEDVLGAMDLNLRAEVESNPTNGGDPSLGTPKLVGSVRFLDQNIISLSAPDGYYDPTTGLYSADIKIRRSNRGGGGTGDGGDSGNGGNSSGGTGNGSGGAGAAPGEETVKVTAYINGDSLNGSVSALDYPGYGGNFQLVKNRRENLQEQLRRARQGKGTRDEQLATFQGSTFFRNSTRPVHIVALRPNRGTSEDFLDVVNPVKHVQLSLNYSRSLQFLFPDAIYDTRQGYIVGEITLSPSQQMTIECTSAGTDLNCVHISTGQGKVATTEAKKSDGPLEDIPDAPENRQSLTKIFYGKGKMPSDKKPRTMELRAIYPARSRKADLMEEFFPTTERFLQVSIIFEADTGTSASFSNVKWDMLNGLLDGSAQRSGTTGDYVAYVQCHNFFFTDSKEDFDCDYSTTRSPLISIHFTPPFRK